MSHLKLPLVYADNPNVDEVRALIREQIPEDLRDALTLRFQHPASFAGALSEARKVYVAKPCKRHDEIVSAYAGAGIEAVVIDLDAPAEPEPDEEPKPKATKKKAAAKK